jgi:three-Cys-motif partner protein
VAEVACGSPMRILLNLNDNQENIIKNKIKVQVIINEFEKDKFDLLSQNLNSIWNENVCELKIHNEDFTKIFNNYYDSMKASANFLFLDQNGIKQITEKIFSRLIGLKQTDFLFFISSSYMKRFAEVEEFKRYLNISKLELEGKSYCHIHRIV